ncbi:PQQ-binding-like beta-propeller repeat protein [Mucilaginibacter sp. FT3.2]|uniref:outer membrane protein assembly factor BamB family protein n=1 Tax=Mucilaginibacter sp. FT3.2 TaxID=2723090 RepID=UPI001611CCDA|nr:PQQ-binding-like beta-propeller repeat protein [Mucilaginibacter sp. FT3.2]MBB6232734.1 outer membrane protein assembly factor BamB [Mucilaginibacter sp. FT3.2]
MMRLYFPAIAFFIACIQPNLQKDKAVILNEPTTIKTLKPVQTELGQLKWRFKTEAKLFASPTILNDCIYVGGEDKKVYSINRKTGELIWSFATGGAVNSSPAIHGNMVYATSSDGSFYALDASTGKLKWKFKTEGEKKVGLKGLWGMLSTNLYMEDPYDLYISSPVVLKKGKKATVYFGSGDGYLYALNVNSHHLKWKFKTAGVIHATPALDQNKIYVGSWDSYFYALDQESGKLIWKYKTGEDKKAHLMEGFQATAVIKDGLIFVGCRDGFFYVLDSEKGKLKWKYDAHGSWIVTTAALKDGNVYITTSDSYLFIALNANTGIEKYRIKTCGYNFSSSVIIGNHAYFGDFSGLFYNIDLLSGQVNNTFETHARKMYKREILDTNSRLNFKHTAGKKDLMLYQTTLDVMKQFYRLGSIASAPVIAADGIIYFSSADGYLYALKPGK